jgi:tetratricopeptide (TPR) repeat protein
VSRRAGAATVLALAAAVGCRSAAPKSGPAYLIDPSAEASRPPDPEVERIFRDLQRGIAPAGEISGSDVAHRVLAVEIRLVRGDLPGARRLCSTAMADGVQTAALLAACGEVEARLGSWADAHDLFQAAILRRPEDPGLLGLRRNAAGRAAEEWVAKAGSLLGAGDAHEARLAAERALSILPGDVPALAKAGEAAETDGDPAAAMTDFREAWRRSGKSEWGQRAGDLALRLGRPDEAVAIFTKLADESSRSRPKLREAEEAFVISNWRPEEREAAQAARLTRAQAVDLLLRIVPGLESAPSGPSAIATDILSRPDLAKLTRGIQLGLLTVDPATHRASPDSYLNRNEALRMLTRAARLAGPPATRACLSRTPEGAGIAAACGISIPGAGRYVSGPELREAARVLAQKPR